MPADDIVEAHKHSIRHRKEIQESESCGCFYCLEIFPPDEIVDWFDGGECAVCPRCGIDSVIGDRSGYPIDKSFLKAMRSHWFESSPRP